MQQEMIVDNSIENIDKKKSMKDTKNKISWNNKKLSTNNLSLRNLFSRKKERKTRRKNKEKIKDHSLLIDHHKKSIKEGLHLLKVM